MHKLLIALVASTLIAGTPGCSAPRPASATTSDQIAVMVRVHQFVDAFNVGDTTAALAACTDEMSIIDEFPPYEWHGAGALTKWLDDYQADAMKKGVTDGMVSLGVPRHVDVVADRAYVVAPADYAYKVKGEPVEQVGSTFTFTLQKAAAGWRVTGWAWSRN